MNGCGDAFGWCSGRSGSEYERGTGISGNWGSVQETLGFSPIQEKATGVLPAALSSMLLYPMKDW